MNKLDGTKLDVSVNTLTVALNKFSSREMRDLLNSDETFFERAVMGQILINYLCDKFKMPKSNLCVLDKPRVKKGNGEVHGNYNPKTYRINIYNLTAAKKQPVSIKQFYSVLLHEFMHHYDITYLKLGASPHTSGFYQRISDLQRKLAS